MSNFQNTIPVSEPFLDEVETQLAMKAVSSGEISGFFGGYLGEFETLFSGYCDSKYGVAVSNGTTALHVALAALKLKPGDEVLVSTLTNMATLFAILYEGLIPVPIDIEEDTWNMDTSLLSSKVTSKTKAIMVVHLFGHPVEMDPVMEIADKFGLYVIEDCAEAHGATYKGKKVGSIGHIGCFSFYANKIITTGEGGMCTTDDELLANEMRSLKSLAFGDDNKFMHRAIGYNYRMTNVQAAIGCGQMQKIDEIISNKRRIASSYSKKLNSVCRLKLPIEKDYAFSVHWMYHMGVSNITFDERKKLLSDLKTYGIETREGFIPYNMQEIFISKGLTTPEECPVATRTASESFYLPSSPRLTEDKIEFIANSLLEVLSQNNLLD